MILNCSKRKSDSTVGGAGTVKKVARVQDEVGANLLYLGDHLRKSVVKISLSLVDVCVIEHL